MINFLKKHNKKIEFVLLFLPLVSIFLSLINDWNTNGFTIISILDKYSLLLDLEYKNLILGDEVMEVISWFFPFILWKVISKYWLK